MRFSLITALALAGSALAAPTPSYQKQIQTLEVQILNVINDIVQSKSSLKADYSAGIQTFGDLAYELQGPQPCSIFNPGQPATQNGAIQALQSSTSSLQALSLDLLNPANKVADSAFHANVCVALSYYRSISTFVGA